MLGKEVIKEISGLQKLMYEDIFKDKLRKY